MKGESTRALERSEQKPRCQTVGMVASLAPIPSREIRDLQASEVLQPPDVPYSIHFKSSFSNYIIKDTHVLSVWTSFTQSGKRQFKSLLSGSLIRKKNKLINKESLFNGFLSQLVCVTKPQVKC